jgi:putative peptidoglycan lipid II flippase
LQFGVQLPFIFWRKSADGRPIGSEIRFALETALAPAREVFRNLGPVVLSKGVVQLSAYIDGMIASFLGASAVSSIAYAQTIYLLPISLFGMSVAAAELPEMSRSTGSEEEIYAKLRTRLIAGQRTIAFFVIPTVAGLLILGKFIVAALYQSGKFGHEDTLYVWYILGVLCSARYQDAASLCRYPRDVDRGAWRAVCVSVAAVSERRSADVASPS